IRKGREAGRAGYCQRAELLAEGTRRRLGNKPYLHLVRDDRLHVRAATFVRNGDDIHVQCPDEQFDRQLDSRRWSTVVQLTGVRLRMRDETGEILPRGGRGGTEDIRPFCESDERWKILQRVEPQRLDRDRKAGERAHRGGKDHIAI